MLTKMDERKPLKQGLTKRRQPHDGGGGEMKRKRGDEAGQKAQGDGARKRLDALSVGYFRRVGDRLAEDFEQDEEKGEGIFCFILEKLSLLIKPQ